MIRRTLLLLLPPLAAACSVVPDRPYVPIRRHALQPARPQGPPAAQTGQVLLLRTLRGAPGLEARGLRRVRADGSLEAAFYDEWLAPPADLAEAALRAWLIASGGFSAVAAPGTRLATPLILEAELTALEAQQDRAEAHAGIAALLLREAGGLAEARVLAQRSFIATAPIAPAEPRDAGLRQAEAMQTALGRVFQALESWVLDAMAAR